MACSARCADEADARGVVLTVNGAPVSGAYPHLDLALAWTYEVAADLGTLARIVGIVIEHAVAQTEQGAVAVCVLGDPDHPGFEVAYSGPWTSCAAFPLADESSSESSDEPPTSATARPPHDREEVAPGFNAACALLRLMGGSLSVSSQPRGVTTVHVALAGGGSSVPVGGVESRYAA